jgi:transposase
MAYQRIIKVEILEVLRRYFSGQNISQISETTGFDRKTVRKYVEEVKEKGIVEFDKEKILEIIGEITSKLSGRPQKSITTLKNYEGEISRLINDTDNPLKPKSAFEVITEQHELQGKVSYSSFKRFIASNRLIVLNGKTTCRMEYPAGEQVQIDYCKVGYVLDPLTNKNRTVYAFIGTLSFSRHKYVEYVFSQNQQSFVNSHVNMFNFFGGAPKVLVIDNLKSGVIKPDLYDPTINRAYNELSEYYGCFINPCRVATPKDKPIVERDVQTVREHFRKLKAINNELTLLEANQAVKDWLINTYGQREHGTTHNQPYEEFILEEQPLLMPLPIDPFEPSYWKQAKVHPDHYIQVQKKAYSIPGQYVGKQVFAKVAHNIVSVYYDEKLIKQHTIPKGYRQTDLNDFPENMRAVMDSGMPLFLRKKASMMCEELGMLIDKVLAPHALINMRKAQAIISIASKYPIDIVKTVSEDVLINYRTISLKLFLSLLENQKEPEKEILMSEETSSFIRNIEYFIYGN